MEDIIRSLINIVIDPMGIAVFFFSVALLGILIQLLVLVIFRRVPGQVTSSRLLEGLGRRGNLYKPEIRYSYEYSGRKFSGTSGMVMKEASSVRSMMQDIVDRHPPGKKITVLVNPLNPAHSALPYDVNPFHWVLITLLVISGIFIYFLMTGWYI